MNSLVVIGSLILGWNGVAQSANDSTEHQPVFNEVTCEASAAALNIDQIVYIEDQEEVVLGFDTAEYLPEDFDPYAGNLNDIAFVETEEEVVLGFDTAAYLPDGFDPHITNLKCMEYAVAEEEVIMGFDTLAWLPEDFDPHVGDLDNIQYVKMDHHFMRRFKAGEAIAEVQ